MTSDLGLIPYHSIFKFSVWSTLKQAFVSIFQDCAEGGRDTKLNRPHNVEKHLGMLIMSLEHSTASVLHSMCHRLLCSTVCGAQIIGGP